MTDTPRAATQDEIEKARAAAEAAAAKLAKLQAAQDSKEAQEAARRSEREIEYAKRFYANWRVAAESAKERVPVTDSAYDPGTMGFLERLIQIHLRNENRRAVLDMASASAARSGVSTAECNVPEARYMTLNVVAHIEQIINEEVKRRNNEFRDELDSEREKFISRGA
ncbi:hypothetical protein ABT246_10115 [Streptomyces sp. NPDC001553]|uniref:hypothetical protein n=1 Tax=Streptomyces sp. NPDC001553 TaxID=3154385 RepID=UPI003322C663